MTTSQRPDRCGESAEEETMGDTPREYEGRTDPTRRLAAGLYRRPRVELGLTQAEAADRGCCGERSQRDRELGDCSLGALESIVRMARASGYRVELRLVKVGWATTEAANDNANPPSLRPNHLDDEPPPVSERGPGLVACPARAALRVERRAL